MSNRKLYIIRISILAIGIVYLVNLVVALLTKNWAVIGQFVVALILCTGSIAIVRSEEASRGL